MQDAAHLRTRFLALPSSFWGKSTAGLSRTTIERLVDPFDATVAQDELIGPIFLDALRGRKAWQGHYETMVRFWESLLLGSKTYRGRTVAKHQVLHPLTDAMFNRWHALFAETTRDIFEIDVANRVIRIAQLAGSSIRKRTVLSISQ